MTHIFKVLSQQEPFQVTKQDGTPLQKCQIILQELGSKHADSYACTLLGNTATCKYYPGDIVIATLRFQHSEYQGRCYNEITVQELVSLTRH